LAEKIGVNIRAIKANLILSEIIYGLKVNFHKSLSVGVNIEEAWLLEAYVVETRVGCPYGTLSWTTSVKDYLVGRIKIFQWGRLVLLEFVLLSFLVYLLSFFKASTCIISLIESLFKSFFFWMGARKLIKLIGFVGT
jgi:hypothetical protein